LTTLPASPEEEEERLRSIQFGTPEAAEYEIDGPSNQFTPLPSDVTRKRYCMEQKVVLEEEQTLTQETKANSVVLAEWGSSSRASSSRRRRKNLNRRDGALFAPSPGSSSLYSQDGDDEMEEWTPPRKPLVVTMTAANTSPSMMVMENLASLRMSSMKREEAMLSPLENDNDDDDDSFIFENKENSWLRTFDSVTKLRAMLSPLENDNDDDDDDSFILHNKENSWLRTSDSNLSSPSVAASASDQSTVLVTSPNHHGRAEVAVNLQSIHSDGGAMDNTASPPAKADISSLTYDAHAGETTSPPTNASLGIIHSFGGALGLGEARITY
jgi:hypothetical protein